MQINCLPYLSCSVPKRPMAIITGSSAKEVPAAGWERSWAISSLLSILAIHWDWQYPCPSVTTVLVGFLIHCINSCQAPSLSSMPLKAWEWCLPPTIAGPWETASFDR